MNKKNLFYLCLSMLFSLSISAQTLDVKWSDPIPVDKTNGWFQDYIDVNSKYIYANFADNYYYAKKWKKIVAFDKTTLKKVGEVVIFDKKDPKTKDLTLYKTIIFENTIYIFWSKYVKKESKEEIYVQTFDSKLKPVAAIKKVYEIIDEKGDEKKGEAFVMGNSKVGEKVIIGGELSSDKGDNVKIEYKLLNNKLDFIAAKQVTLPIIVNKKTNSFTSSYSFGDDGNLHVESRITMNKDEAKKLSKGESKSYSVYSIVNLTAGEIKSIPIKFSNKNIFDFDYVEEATGIKLFGFFCDITKDKDGNDIHGIFYGIIDPKTYKLISDFKFTYFTAKQLDELFAKDKQDRKDKKGIFASKKEKKSEEESMSSDYIIEKVQSIEKDKLVLFCSIMDNYSYQQCTTNSNGSTTCRTVYKCDKKNVTAIKINKDGQIDWATNLDRKANYNGWNVFDIEVINKDKKFIVIYGSDTDDVGKEDGEKKTKKEKKELYDDENDRVEYAVFDNATGKFEKKNYIINPVGTPKKEKKVFSVMNVYEMENDFYTRSIRKKGDLASMCRCFCIAIFQKQLPTHIGKFVVVK